MGMLDKLRDFLMIPNDDQYDSDDSDYENEEQEEREAKSKVMYEEQEKSKVVNFNSVSDRQDKFSVVLVKPKAYREGDSIADHLNAKKIVILNLEEANQTDSIRLVDFLSGAAYAIGGKIEKINSDIYIIAPYNVEFSGDVVQELTGGIYL